MKVSGPQINCIKELRILSGWRVHESASVMPEVQGFVP
jgi:hypothetical protein